MGWRIDGRSRLAGDEIEQDRVYVAGALVGLPGIDDVMTQALTPCEGIDTRLRAMRSPAFYEMLGHPIIDGLIILVARHDDGTRSRSRGLRRAENLLPQPHHRSQAARRKAKIAIIRPLFERAKTLRHDVGQRQQYLHGKPVGCVIDGGW